MADLFPIGTPIGLRDIKGNFIFVGDKISYSVFPDVKYKGIIKYDKENACFCVVRETGEKNTFFVIKDFEKEV